jgi:hypothetical protein
MWGGGGGEEAWPPSNCQSVVPAHLWAETEGWMGAGEAAEGDEEIGGSEGARERRR